MVHHLTDPTARTVRPNRQLGIPADLRAGPAQLRLADDRPRRMELLSPIELAHVPNMTGNGGSSCRITAQSHCPATIHTTPRPCRYPQAKIANNAP